MLYAGGTLKNVTLKITGNVHKSHIPVRTYAHLIFHLGEDENVNGTLL